MTQSDTSIVAHTPGPWRFVPDEDDGHLYDAYSIRADSTAAFAQWGLMGDYQGCEVAKVCRNPAVRLTDPEFAIIEANAALIAAAPVMYEALKDLVGMFCAEDCDHTGCDYRAGASAIASAESR